MPHVNNMKTIILPSYTKNGLDWIYPIFDLIKNAIILTDHTSKILYANAAYLKNTQYSLDEILGQNAGMMRSGYHDETFYKNMWQSIINIGLWNGEVWNRNKSGKIYPIDLTLSKLQIETEKEPYYLAISTDILIAKTQDAENINLAFTDLLTKLPTKIAAENYFARTVKNLQREKTAIDNKLSIIYIDLDDFKSINTQYGYVAGDRVLASFANRLDLLISKSDYLARLENDHFLIIMTVLRSDDELKKFSMQLTDEFSRPFVIVGVNMYANCSIGITNLTNSTQTLDELIKSAAKFQK